MSKTNRCLIASKRGSGASIGKCKLAGFASNNTMRPRQLLRSTCSQATTQWCRPNPNQIYSRSLYRARQPTLTNFYSRKQRQERVVRSAITTWTGRTHWLISACSRLTRHRYWMDPGPRANNLKAGNAMPTKQWVWPIKYDSSDGVCCAGELLLVGHMFLAFFLN